MKITFAGDIMCEMPLLKAAKKNGTYSFENVFSGTRDFFGHSDLVVANLETPFAGEQAHFTKDLFSFNTPTEFLDALKDSGIDIVQTANNHCLDRGTEGLDHTMAELEKRNIPYFGTARKPGKRYLVRNVGDTALAFLGYTLTTNHARNGVSLSDGEQYLVNLMMPMENNVYGQNASEKSGSRGITRKIPSQWKLQAKRMLGKNTRVARTDKLTGEVREALFLNEIKKDIAEARKEADLVFCCLHMGGQFNTEPGELVEYIVGELSKSGADALICSHPHVVQKIEWHNGIPCVYSLGNYSMSPSSPYLVLENLPEYGMAFHVYTESGKITKTSVSVLKMLEDRSGMLTVRPVHEIYRETTSAEVKVKLEEDMKRILGWIGEPCEDRFEIRRLLEQEEMDKNEAV